MTYRTLMVQLSEEEGLRERLAVAVNLARRFGAGLIGVHVIPPPVLPAGYGDATAYIGPELIEAQREVALEKAERVRGAFEESTRSPDIDARFVLEEGDPTTCFAASSHVCDLVLVARPWRRGIDAIVPDLCEQLIVGSGSPSLMLPREAGESLGRKIVVAWSGSKESGRALRDALPFLREAEEIRLVTIGDPEHARLEEALGAMRRHGLRPISRVIDDSGLAPGPALLEEARAMGADLLVMGAYGHSRLREVVMGGATRHVIERAHLPVLFSA